MDQLDQKAITEHSVSINGLRVAIAFEFQPELFQSLIGDRTDLEESLDISTSAAEEVFRRTEVPAQVHEKLLELHSELYRNLLDAALGFLAEPVSPLVGPANDSTARNQTLEGSE